MWFGSNTSTPLRRSELRVTARLLLHQLLLHQLLHQLLLHQLLLHQLLLLLLQLGTGLRWLCEANGRKR